MKTERYFFNEETSELIILSRDGDDSQVTTLSELCSYEYEDENTAFDEKKKVISSVLSDVEAATRAIILDGMDDYSLRKNRHVTKILRELVKEMLSNGYNSKRISSTIGEDLEFTNKIIDRVRGDDMDAKVEDDKEGVSL